MKKQLLIILILLFLNQSRAISQVKIVRVSGDVRVRWGIEESWNKAFVGMVLRPEDSIQTGNSGMAVLQLKAGTELKMTSNAYIDIVECRQITEKQFFLALMSEKVMNLEKQDKLRLKIGDVTVIHGADRRPDSARYEALPDELWRLELAGAEILDHHNLSMNAILKMKKIVRQYDPDDGGEIQLKMGTIFQKLGYSGHAQEAFQRVLEADSDQRWKNLAASKIQSLRAK